MDRKVELMKKLIDLYEQRSFVGNYVEVPCTRMIVDDHIKQMERQLSRELSGQTVSVDNDTKTEEESYKYFVSFYYDRRNRKNIIRNMIIDVNNPITELNIRDVENAIRRDLNAEKVVLINIIEQ